MITKELIEYIKSERALGVNDEAIKQSLVGGGWNMTDAQEAFNSLGPVSRPAPVSTPVTMPTAAQVNPAVNAFSPAPAASAVTMQRVSPQSTPKSKKGGLVLTLVVLVVVGAAAYAYINDTLPFFSKAAVQEVSQTQTRPKNQAQSFTVLATSTPTAAPTQTISANNLWSIVDAYVAALKTKNLDSVNAIIYKQIPASTPSTTIDIAFPSLYESASKLRSSDFMFRVQDDRQAIYSSALVKENSTTAVGYSRYTLFFIKDKGTWKLLKNFDRGWSVSLAGTNKGPVQIEAELQSMISDADKDGRTDMEENCGGSMMGNKTCVKTNPNKDDSDSDGWWDGVEEFMEG